DEAFEIAEKLLAVKIKESKYFASWHDLQGRFDDYCYGELVFKYFRVLWEKEGQALRAGRLLIELLSAQIEADRKIRAKEPVPPALKAKMKEIFSENEKEKKDKEDYDLTSHSYITIPSLAKLGNGGDIAEVLVAGIGQIGRYLMEKDETQAREYIGLLEEKDKSIFRRIKLHVLRYAKGQECKQDIEKILIEKQYCEDDRIRAEFNVLLSDKWEIISDSSRQSYITWAEGHGLDDVDEFKKWFFEAWKREATDDDIEADNHYLKAQALYCVSDKDEVREIYQEHLRKSKRNEADVRPRPRVREVEVWAPGSPEYSPLSLEAMQEKTATEVVEYILDYDRQHPDKSDDEEDIRERIDTKEALANVFKQDVGLRASEYIEVEKDLIIGISRRFIRNYLYGLDEALNSQKLKGPNWDKILAVLSTLVRTKGLTEEYRSISEVVIRVLERGFKVETCKLPVEPKAMKIIWEILTQLLDYLEEGDVEEGGDALTGCINCPPGLAFENIVRFGIYYKNGDEKLFNKEYAGKIRETMSHVINDIPLLKVKCVFGVFFNNLCWLAEEWVKTNLDQIFPKDNQREWDGIWESFVKWSQPSKLGFQISQCKYAHAVDSIEGQMVYQDKKDYNKRLMEHVMLAYWQGWTGLEEDGLVKNLLAKMDDRMRAWACHWLATGFEHLKDRERDEWQTGVEKRLLKYWNWRYEAMEASPAEHQEEAREFTCWVKDTPFDAETALEITEKAMKTAGGVAKRMRDVGDYVEGLRSIATGRELRVMRLLQKAIKDQDVEPWAWSYERVKNPLVALMDQIVELGDNSDTQEIRQIAIGIADSLGRLGHEYLRQHYDMLTQNENRVG
ncbi:MAG: hypothetical protein KAT56_06435, partial [Sedimentisphaerales bacterium]|nr:hypothetical protein [Sedimentisphaerales bacterium]